MRKRYSEHEIPHKKTGKLVVATGSSEIPKLDMLMHLGTQNGVSGPRMLEGFEAMRMEPEPRCVKALLSPESGILDTHSFMLSLSLGAAPANTLFGLLHPKPNASMGVSNLALV